MHNEVGTRSGFVLQSRSVVVPDVIPLPIRASRRASHGSDRPEVGIAAAMLTQNTIDPIVVIRVIERAIVVTDITGTQQSAARPREPWKAASSGKRRDRMRATERMPCYAPLRFLCTRFPRDATTAWFGDEKGTRLEFAAAPATVTGERSSDTPLRPCLGKADESGDPGARRPASCRRPVSGRGARGATGQPLRRHVSCRRTLLKSMLFARQLLE